MRYTKGNLDFAVGFPRPRLPDLRCSLLAARLALSFSLVHSIGAYASTNSNATSPLGINVAAVRYWTPEQPFLNIFSTADMWITHSTAWETNEEKYLNLDADGWPITLTAVNDPNPQNFTSVGVLLLRDLPNTPNGYYPAGQYVVLYDGQGTLGYGMDAVLVSRAAGKDTINVVTPSTAGIELRVVATDPRHTGNYIRNIRVVKAENLKALVAGQIFDPRFINLMKNFRAVRFMDWLSTNGNTLSSWSGRPSLSSAFWGTPNGVPIEVAVALANTISADAWLNTPAMADDDYIVQMARLVHRQIGSSQKVYVELSNEVWNGVFPQYRYAIAQGHAKFPAGLGSDYAYNRNWYGMRVGQMCDIWTAVWGADSHRVVCLLAAQAANTYTASEALKCPFWAAGKPCAAHNIAGVAIGPYFGGDVPTEWTSHPDGGLAELFASLHVQNSPSVPAGGWLGQTSSWEKEYIALLAGYKLPLYCYECGEGFVNASEALTRLYHAANLDSRMAAAYDAYLRQWKVNGGQMLMLYDDISALSSYGDWGALQSIMQTTDPLERAPHKWQAIQKFILSSPCWWSECTGKINSAK